ncbi:MAG: N-succinylarginine dihydrolase [Opitutaceae bacterium]|nr:N-succinylarginine dihydrolase [Opitutaceae bacterium]
MTAASEVNFDGLVGPTHNYAGLSYGNVASMRHRGDVSNPREAALQGLAKMKMLADLGLPQAVLPPHERPSIATLRAFGFSGSDAAVLEAAARQAPALLAACASAANMWVANAATVAPSADTADGRVHITPANLASKFHRAIEPPQTARTFRAIFADPSRFVVHDPVPSDAASGDEGAANHTRLAPVHAQCGLHFFVYGLDGTGAAAGGPRPVRYPPRQARAASEAIARLHLLSAPQVCFAQQHPGAIDAGVFHNDVISVGNENVLLYHEHAFVHGAGVIDSLRRQYRRLHRDAELIAIKVPAKHVTLADAVRTYFFNSQLVTLGPGRMALIAPEECRTTSSVCRFIHELLARDGPAPIREVHYVNLRESMRNGGGPACLRLRVVLTKAELATLRPALFITGASFATLTGWVRSHYRDKIAPADLADPRLLEESRQALDNLTQILGLGSIYPFQTG